MIDPHQYTITIRMADFEGENLYEAKVKELPDIAEYAETHEEAYLLALDAIETTAGLLAEQGREMPKPYTPEENYSGRITLRIPKTLHRRLAEIADEEEVSLNQYMVSILSEYGGVLVKTHNQMQKVG